MTLNCGPILPIILMLLLTACGEVPSKPTAIKVSCETITKPEYSQQFQNKLLDELSKIPVGDPIRITEDDYRIMRSDRDKCIAIGKKG
jgi:hypothetical protein